MRERCWRTFSASCQNPRQLSPNAQLPLFWWGLYPLSLGMVEILGCGILKLSRETEGPRRNHGGGIDETESPRSQDQQPESSFALRSALCRTGSDSVPNQLLRRRRRTYRHRRGNPERPFQNWLQDLGRDHELAGKQSHHATYALKMGSLPCASPTSLSPGSPETRLPSDSPGCQQKNGSGCKKLS